MAIKTKEIFKIPLKLNSLNIDFSDLNIQNTIIEKSNYFLLAGHILNNFKFNKKAKFLQENLTKQKHYYDAKSLANFYAIDQVISEFNKENIKFVILKGMALDIYGIYKNNDRFYKDIDILVNKNDLKKAYECLKKIGFNYFEADVNDSSKYIYNWHQLPALVNKNRVFVELHTRVTKYDKKCPYTESLLKNSIKIDNYVVPAVDDLILHLLNHGVNSHERQGLIFIYDILNIFLLFDCKKVDIVNKIHNKKEISIFNKIILFYEEYYLKENIENSIKIFDTIFKEVKKIKYKESLASWIKIRFLYISYKYQVPLFSLKYFIFNLVHIKQKLNKLS